VREASRSRIAFGYVMAAAVSVVSVGLIAGLQHVVGYVPMLFLPAIVLVQSLWGVRKAVLATILCTLGSLLLMASKPDVAAKVHIWANLLLLPGIAASLIYLMETRRRHQQIEHERGAELSILLESMSEAVFIFNTGGRVMEANRAAELLADCSAQELRGMRLRELAHRVGAHRDSDPIDYERLAVTRALRGEPVRDEPRTLRDPGDGTALLTLLSANPMRDPSGRLLGAVLVVRDMTEVTELQNKVAAAERHTAIGQMAAGIAHDFNNVLDTISQATAVMELRRGSPEHNASYLRMIQNAVRRGAEIIGRVREYIRGGVGEQRALDVCQVIEEALELTNPLWRELPNVKVERDLQPVAPVRANAADLRRVFTNLIINSIQAMGDGGKIMVRCGEVNGKVVASVSDTGPGIPLNLQKKIFLPYFTTKPRGTGLGLSGAQRIVQATGGAISFVSEPGEGTTFTVELPKVGTMVGTEDAKKEEPKAA
jgi:PAS domain S-box-containing protein